MKTPQQKEIEEVQEQGIEMEIQNWTPSSYELLKREGELHLRGGDILEELRQNIDELEELHGRLKFMMREVQGLIRR